MTLGCSPKSSSPLQEFPKGVDAEDWTIPPHPQYDRQGKYERGGNSRRLKTFSHPPADQWENKGGEKFLVFVQQNYESSSAEGAASFIESEH